jgi:hypothetical protein
VYPSSVHKDLEVGGTISGINNKLVVFHSLDVMGF